MRVVFLLEESSMEVFLNSLLGRYFPELIFQCVVYNGWADLERSVPGTLKSWHVPGDRFMVVRDSDQHDCYELKQRIIESCNGSGHDDVLVRIVCQELEAWYLGDFDALAQAYNAPRLLQQRRKARFRNPDTVVNPAEVVSRMVSGVNGRFNKTDAARRMGNAMDLEQNRSGSFRVFVEGVRRLGGKLA